MPESTTPPSWQPDPFGRYAQRYWDGSQWTANVTDASGAQHSDPPVPSPSAGSPPPARAAMSGGSALPLPGLILGGIGALLLLLSNFGLTWFSVSGRDFNLSDLRDLAEGADDLDALADQYLSWGYLIAIAAVAFAIVALFVTNLRLPAVIAAGVVAIWHARTAYVLGTEDISPEFGAWLGAVGLVLAAVALLLPRPTGARAT